MSVSDIETPKILRPRLVGRGVNASLAVGGAIMAAMLCVALFAPLLAPHSPYDQALDARMLKPVFLGGGWDHPLGTDNLGRDVLSRLIYGSRMSLAVGFGTVGLSALIGVGLGLLAGYKGGRVDTGVMFLLNVRLSLPIMLAAVAIVGLLGNSLGLMMLIMALFLWDQFLVVTRSITMRLQSTDYVMAAKCAGFSDLRIMIREILPSLSGPLVIVATLEMANAVMLESALSFLGLGVRPPASSWGLMVAEGKDFVFFQPWIVQIPGFAIFVLVAGITLLGEGLRSAVQRRDRV